MFNVDLKAFQKLTLVLDIGCYYSSAYLLLIYRRKVAINVLRQGT